MSKSDRVGRALALATAAFVSMPGGVAQAGGTSRRRRRELFPGEYQWQTPLTAYRESGFGRVHNNGHFFTLVGYEVVPAPNNFFYSHALTIYNSEPFTHTGAIGPYSDLNGNGVAGAFEPYSGWSLGWGDTGFDQRRVPGGAQFAPNPDSTRDGVASLDLNVTSERLLGKIEQENRARQARGVAGIEGVAAVDALVRPVPPPRVQPLWHVWVEGRGGEHEHGPASDEIESDLAELTAGAYHTSFTTGNTTGGYLNFRSVEGGIGGLTDYDGDAVGAALFHIRPFGDNLLAKFLVFFEGGDADVLLPIGSTASFDFNTWQIEGEIAAHREFGHWWVRPRANLFYADTHRDGFTDSFGATAPSADSDTLRLTIGPRVGTRVWAGDDLGIVSPYFEIEGQWDIVDGPDLIAPSGATIANDPFNFRLAGGVNMEIFGAGNLALEASVIGGGGGDDEGYDLEGSVNIPLN